MPSPRTSFLLAVVCAVVGAAAPAAVSAQAGTVTFAPTGDGGPVVPVFTGPTLVQTGLVRSTFGSAASVGELAAWESPQYSGGSAVYGNVNQVGTVAEFALTGTVGTALSFSAATFGGYPDAARVIRVRLYDAAFTQLFDQLLSVPSSPQQSINFGSVTTTSGTLRMQWTEATAAGTAEGRGAYDVGFSSLNYFVGARAAVVPEPSTYALVAAGLAGLGVVARRRRGHIGAA